MTDPELLARAERELCADLRLRVVHEAGNYQLQRLDPSGAHVLAVRPTTKPVFTLWSEAVRGRVALLQNWMRETGRD